MRAVDTLLQRTPFHLHDAPIANITKGGSFAHLVDYKSLVSANPYVKQHLIAVLIQAPRGFDLLPEPSIWYRSLKAIVEEQSREISGLNSTLQITNVEHNVGSDGNKIYAVADVTREESNPQHTIYEKYNLPMTAFLNTWITELMMDPITKYPNIITRPGIKLPDHMVDFYGATILYFEPDPTFSKVLKAWLCMFARPKTQGPEVTGSKNPLSAKEDLDIQLELTATTMVGAGPQMLAQKILATMNPVNTNPHYQPAPFDDIEAKVKAVTQTGYREKMEEAAQVALRQ